MRNFILLLAVFIVSGCAAPQLQTKNFDELSGLCKNDNLSACTLAADKIFNLRPSYLKACSSAEALCIQQGETRESAIYRLREDALQFSIKSCDNGANANSCLMAGSFWARKASKLSNEAYKPIANKSDAYYGKACELGLKSGCMLIGTTYRAGT